MHLLVDLLNLNLKLAKCLLDIGATAASARRCLTIIVLTFPGVTAFVLFFNFLCPLLALSFGLALLGLLWLRLCSFLS